MPGLGCQTLNAAECLEVLRRTSVTRVAFGGDAPYIVPMAFGLDGEGLTPVIRLMLTLGGRKEKSLEQLDRVCLEFELPGCAWVDVVLLEGRALPAGDECQGSRPYFVRADRVSGRRFFWLEEMGGG